mgnify:CR=1 FL=1
MYVQNDGSCTYDIKFDDGDRDLPAGYDSPDGDFGWALTDNSSLLVMQEGPAGPDVSFDMTGGQRWDLNQDLSIGVLASASYSNEWTTREGTRGFANLEGDGLSPRFPEGLDLRSTENSIGINGYASVGFDIFSDRDATEQKPTPALDSWLLLRGQIGERSGPDDSLPAVFPLFGVISFDRSSYPPTIDDRTVEPIVVELLRMASSELDGRSAQIYPVVENGPSVGAENPGHILAEGDGIKAGDSFDAGKPVQVEGLLGSTSLGEHFVVNSKTVEEA